MCHGVPSIDRDIPLTTQHFDQLMRIASDLGFESINYTQLENWRNGKSDLPPRPIMIDFDHAVKSMRRDVHDVLTQYGFTGNLFIHTGPMLDGDTGYMSWDEVGELVELGWHIGSHTVTHPNLSELSLKDPTGDKLWEELVQCDETIKKYLGIQPRDFAYTGTSFSTVALKLVKQRYRFGRLWIKQALYEVDGKFIRYADLVKATGEDEDDGGPPSKARYIDWDTDAYLLPSMELQSLIYEPEAFRGYLENA